MSMHSFIDSEDDSVKVLRHVNSRRGSSNIFTGLKPGKVISEREDTESINFSTPRES